MNSIITVSQLNSYMSMKISEDKNLSSLLVKGEVSGFTNHAKTGHFYFTLKDKTSSIKAIMFASYANKVPFTVQNGMSVIVVANLKVFERDGIYQLYVTDIQPDGIGSVQLAIDQLKEKLANEGLFDEKYKKPIPTFPKRIGIVTSKDAAALRDVLNILNRRYPICEAIIFPCLVQGEYAPESICEALNWADESDCDVIICGRGGGSTEDLMAFNSEKVAKTIFSLNTPTISAVGHETDFSISDFVADMRAPTPSAAAEIATPDKIYLNGVMLASKNNLQKALVSYIEKKYTDIDSRKKLLLDKSPEKLFEKYQNDISNKEDKLKSALALILERKQSDFDKRLNKLDALSPLNVLKRGYSIAYDDNKRIIKSTSDIAVGDIIKVQLSDGGMITARTEEIEK